MINIIVSILFLLFVTSLTLTLFTIIKHTEKVLPVLESFKWPLANAPIPTTLSLTKYTEYSIEEHIKNKLISINDDENDGYKLYFDNQSIKNKFIFDVTNYDFVFYYAQIDQDKNKYYIPNDYVFSNSRDNKKPTGTEYKFRIGLVLTQVQETGSEEIINIDYKTLNLYNHITTNMLYWYSNNKIYNFVKSFNNYNINYTFNNSLVAQIVLAVRNESQGATQSSHAGFDYQLQEKIGYLYVDDKQNINIILTDTEQQSTIDNYISGRFDENNNYILFENGIKYFPEIDYSNRFDYNFNILKYNKLTTKLERQASPSEADGSNIDNLSTLFRRSYPDPYYKAKIHIYNGTYGIYNITLKINNKPIDNLMSVFDTARNNWAMILCETNNDLIKNNTKISNLNSAQISEFNSNSIKINVLPVGINNNKDELFFYNVPDFINLDYSYTLEITKN